MPASDDVQQWCSSFVWTTVRMPPLPLVWFLISFATPPPNTGETMPWQSAPPLAIITIAMGGVSGLMSLTNYLTVGRTDRLIGLDDFDYM